MSKNVEVGALSVTVAGQYVIMRDEQPVGVLMPVEAHVDSLRSSLQVAGYDTTHEDQLQSLNAECSVAKPRPCDLSVAVGYARDLAHDAGVDSSELDALAANGYNDEGEIKSALEATRDRLQGKERKEAEAVIGYVFGTHTAESPEA
jgi:hypothetical protein